jgi:HlyD family secretion protein
MTIRDASSMDRPIERRRTSRWMLVGIGGSIVLIVALLWPVVGRWVSVERSVARDRLRFGTVTRGDLEHTVAVEGRVVAASRPTLYSPSDGTVSIRVVEGQQVMEGDVLAVVASPELQSLLRQEGATADALESDLRRLELENRRRDLENAQAVELAGVREAAAARLVKRNEELHELGLLNQIDLEASRDARRIAALELAQARQRHELEQGMLEFEVRDASLRLERQRLVVQDLQRQVTDLRIKAPFDGMVASVMVEDRDAVVRTSPILGVVDLTDLEMEIGIPESAADDVAPGVAAVLTIDGREHRGTLTRVAPEVRGGQVVGRVAFDGGLPAGLRQNQRIPTRLLLEHRADVLKVPRGPFLEEGGGRWAYVVQDGLATRRTIAVGAVSVSEVEIADGLEIGDEIVLSDMSRFDGADTVLLRH